MKTFPRGGVHPSDNKLTSGNRIRVLPLPEKVAIPISQHIGAPPAIMVTQGDYVKTGDLIASAQGKISSNIHSSVSGTVSKIDLVVDTSGYKQPAVLIDVEGDEWLGSIDRSDKVIREFNLTQEEIINRCSEAGIVGMGGAAFPLHVKLRIPDSMKCEYLMINGVECEPYLTSDHRLMLEKGEEILIGVTILMKALNTKKAMIGIENNKPDAIEHLSKLAESYKGITVHSLKVKYPQGAEKQLIKALVNREVPTGKLPISIGVVVQNVATAFAVYEAVQKNKPLFERVVTISGKNLTKPGNFLVRVGTPLDKLIMEAGGMPEDTGKIVNGGPMMGKALNNTAVPVTKGTSGIILFNQSEAVRGTLQPCIRCGKCVTVCGLTLEPHLLMKLSEKGMFEAAEIQKITNCMECGSCSFICPSNRPILDYIRLGKATVNKMIRERNSN